MTRPKHSEETALGELLHTARRMRGNWSIRAIDSQTPQAACPSLGPSVRFRQLALCVSNH